jgi:hypothetical protein
MRRGRLPPSASLKRFTELQERHTMTPASESGIKSEHSEGERTPVSLAQTTNAEHMRSATTASISVRNRRFGNEFGFGFFFSIRSSFSGETA